MKKWFNEKIMTKWTIFWIVSVAFIISDIFFNLDLYERFNKCEIRLEEFFRINGTLFAIYGVVISTFLSVTNSLENNKIIKERLEFDKKDNAMKLIDKWDNSLLLEARDFTREIKEKRPTLSDNDLITEIETQSKDDKHKNLKRSIIICFNFFESIYLSTNRGLSDESILKDSFQYIYNDIYIRFKPWIENEKHCNKITKANLDKLYEQWRIKS